MVPGGLDLFWNGNHVVQGAPRQDGRTPEKSDQLRLDAIDLRPGEWACLRGDMSYSGYLQADATL